MSRRGWLPAYLTLVVFWGCSFLFNEWALRSFSPLAVAFGRIALGMLTLGLLLLLARQRVQLRRSDVVDAQTRVTSILAGLLNATTPLWTAVAVGLLIPSERPDRRQLVGLGVGFAGIAVLLGVWDLQALDTLGALAMLLATACYGLGTVWVRRSFTGSNLSGASLSFVQLVFASVLVLPFVPLGGAPGAIEPESVLALVGLGVFGTGLAYVLFWRVVRTAGATVAATVTYLIPLVSTTLGILVLGEPLSWNEPVGGVIVLLGVALAQGLLGTRRAASP